MAKRKAKKKGKRKGKKQLPPVMVAWSRCRPKVGAKPGKKLTAKQRREAEACVEKEVARIRKSRGA